MQWLGAHCILCAGAHDARYVELQADKRLGLVQQLFHAPALLEGPYGDGGLQQQPRVELLQVVRRGSENIRNRSITAIRYLLKEAGRGAGEAAVVGVEQAQAPPRCGG